jgi:hypothetical protein
MRTEDRVRTGSDPSRALVYGSGISYGAGGFAVTRIDHTTDIPSVLVSPRLDFQPTSIATINASDRPGAFRLVFPESEYLIGESIISRADAIGFNFDFTQQADRDLARSIPGFTRIHNWAAAYQFIYTAQVDGEYTFRVVNDGITDLWVDGTIRISQLEPTYTVSLVAGQRLEMVLVYSTGSATDDANLSFDVSIDGGSFTAVTVDDTFQAFAPARFTTTPLSSFDPEDDVVGGEYVGAEFPSRPGFPVVVGRGNLAWFPFDVTGRPVTVEDPRISGECVMRTQGGYALVGATEGVLLYDVNNLDQVLDYRYLPFKPAILQELEDCSILALSRDGREGAILCAPGKTIGYEHAVSVKNANNVIASAVFLPRAGGFDAVTDDAILYLACEDYGLRSWTIKTGGRHGIEFEYQRLEDARTIHDVALYQSPPRAGLQFFYSNFTYDVPEFSQGNFPAIYDSLAEPQFRGTDSALNINDFRDAPEEYYMDYTGSIYLDEAGVYTFGVGSDDGSMLYIDGELIVDNDYAQEYTIRSAEVELSAGFHSIRIEYYQGPVGNSYLNLYYEPPSSSDGLELFPPSRFYTDPEATTAFHEVFVATTQELDEDNLDYTAPRHRVGPALQGFVVAHRGESAVSRTYDPAFPTPYGIRYLSPGIPTYEFSPHTAIGGTIMYSDGETLTVPTIDDDETWTTTTPSEAETSELGFEQNQAGDWAIYFEVAFPDGAVADPFVVRTRERTNPSRESRIGINSDLEWGVDIGFGAEADNPVLANKGPGHFYRCVMRIRRRLGGVDGFTSLTVDGVVVTTRNYKSGQQAAILTPLQFGGEQRCKFGLVRFYEKLITDEETIAMTRVRE